LLNCYTILGYSIETVLLIFPFLQTNITVQMRPSGVRRSERRGKKEGKEETRRDSKGWE